MADEHERHPAENCSGQSRPAPRIGHQAGVRVVVEHRLMHAVARFQTDADVDVGKSLPEAGEQRRQAIESDAGTRGNFQRAGAGPDFVHRVHQRIFEADHVPAVFVADLSGRIQVDPAEAGYGQRQVEGLFERMERLAGIGRRATVKAGGTGEALSDRHVAEHPQGSHLHNAPAYPKIKSLSLLWSLRTATSADGRRYRLTRADETCGGSPAAGCR